MESEKMEKYIDLAIRSLRSNDVVEAVTPWGFCRFRTEAENDIETAVLNLQKIKQELRYGQ